jgi:hypothetical protein
MSTPNRSEFVIRLRDLPGHPSPAYRRLARILKTLKRAYNFVCIEVQEAQPSRAKEVAVMDCAEETPPGCAGDPQAPATSRSMVEDCP